ncbi:hypothetical protein K7X08_011995 [Anisodus acutangulus]|uniref:Uncharacterized protein n=1 Tax=Anisodus acutangulus TaxID=402998 RepID=A0A9Q1QY73_9SOLA|nr:hypothetical protein K7X08_011995 [Anisodus acutangulus]
MVIFLFTYAWEYKAVSFAEKIDALSKQRPLSISRILRWRTEEKPEAVDPFKNAIDSHAVVRYFLHPDDEEKSKDSIKNLVDYDDEVPHMNIDALKRGIVNSFDSSPLSDPTHVTNVDGSSSYFPDQVDDPLTDLAYVHNNDGPSCMLPDQVDHPSCKTLPLIDPDHVPNGDVAGEVTDSVVASEYRSPDERITDVLAQLNSEDDIEEVGDVAQNDNETANEEVV